MRLAHVRLCGFRGYRKLVEIEFSPSFTIIDGRNGVGKSSIFDAVEFALLGSLTKYGEMSAAGETVDQYVWWRGPGSVPSERFVEVGFQIGDEVLSIKRTMLTGPDPKALGAVTAALMSEAHAPEAALRQLCTSIIIRDEQIAELSLDLKEGERFKRLRDALGASDAERWTKRASRIHEIAKTRREAAHQEVNMATSTANTLSAQIEETRRSVPDRSVIDEATARLRIFSGDAGTSTAPDAFRASITNAQTRLSALARLEDEWSQASSARAFLDENQTQLQALEASRSEAAAQLAELDRDLSDGRPSSAVQAAVEAYASLLASGEAVGLQDDHCPLCAAARTPSEFAQGIELGRTQVAALDQEALARAQLEQRYHETRLKRQHLDDEHTRLTAVRAASLRRAEEYQQRLIDNGLAPATTVDQIRDRRTVEESRLSQAERDFAIVSSLRLSAALDNQLGSLRATQQRRQAAEEKLAIARRAEARAKAIFDAVRRTAGDILNERLDLVMPLMSEFYKRLRPHPIWEEIDYKLRGDVQKSLRLQVGEDLNPQFIYSSGQRRATGLAFLLSVNLSLSWNNWKSIMLDDPVQHIDDFRSVHLAEVLSKILASGRQIICAAEDEALADLMVRHLAFEDQEPGKRITLGVDPSGALAKLDERLVTPMPRGVFVAASSEQTAG